MVGVSVVAVQFVLRVQTGHEDLHMKWETPEAIDFRFGMEITMYVSNR